MISVTLEQLKSAPAGSTVQDVSDDTWTKSLDGTWSILVDGGDGYNGYQNWSSERLSEKYNEYYHGALHNLILSAAAENYILKSDIVEWMRMNAPAETAPGRIRKAIYSELCEEFDLPAVKQKVAVVTLRFPVDENWTGTAEQIAANEMFERTTSTALADYIVSAEILQEELS